METLQSRREIQRGERGLLRIPDWQHLVILLVSYFHVLPNDYFMQNLWMVLGVGVRSKSPFPGQLSHWQDRDLNFINYTFRTFCLWRSDSGERTTTLCSQLFYNLLLFRPLGFLQETGVKKMLLQLLPVRSNDPNCSTLCTHHCLGMLTVQTDYAVQKYLTTFYLFLLQEKFPK